MSKLPSPIRKIFKFLKIGPLGIIKSLVINIRVLPFKEAVKLPILVSGKTTLYHIHKGCIEFTSPVKTGMLTFGINLKEYSYDSPVFLRIQGKLIIHGNNSHIFGPGTTLFITETGKLEIGDNFSVDHKSRWVISAHSTIGENNMYSWHLILLDTDAHPIYDENKNRINGPRGFYIGDNVWLGSRSTILKVSKIESGCIVASNSVVTKQLQIPNSIYIGNKWIKGNVKWERPVDNMTNVNKQT